MTKNTQGSELFENADTDPGTAYELGRHDERLALLQKVRERVGFLRQYLNERTSSEPITNKEIEVMLELEGEI